MTQTSRIFTLCLSLLILTATGFAQNQGNRQNRPEGNRQQGNRQQANRPNMSVEEWKKQQADNINKKTAAFMKKMGKAVPEDKVVAVTNVVQQHFIGELKIQMALMAARQKAGDDRKAMRQLMTKRQEQVKALAANTGDAAAKLLDKKPLSTFKKNLAQSSQQGGQGGGGRGGQGGGRGGQGGGGGGGGGGGR